ncbi:MAG TPA: ABC transporter permease [Acidimicrobiales bacterium]|nr:ABC transporter permease [Acidimicrobiales bacterium]
MKPVYVVLVVLFGVSVGIIRFRQFRARHRRRTEAGAGRTPEGRTDASPARAQMPTAPVAAVPPSPQERTAVRRAADIGERLGDVGQIAMREVTERVRSRIFRVGTIIVLVAVALAIIIPQLEKSSSGPTPQAVGVVGTVSPTLEHLVAAAGRGDKDKVRFVTEGSLARAESGLRTKKLAFAIVGGSEVLLWEPASLSSSPADPTLVDDTAEYLGVFQAYRTAGLTPAQAADIDNSKSAPVRTLQSGSSHSAHIVPVIGIILMFVMLSQYCTWTLIGVMQEKSSRVVEVLLAMVRPLQLLAGKVLGIGLVALGQATLVVAFALLLAEGVGSDVLKGDQPLAVAALLLWLVLGYAFYCWLYAAAGSTAERQDQIQTLALPLSIPMLIGYVYSLTVASSGSPDTFFKVLAYLPPTAPFCMSVLVALGQATWWEFVASVLIAIAGTAAMAVFAARIYRRAVLHTGGRVRLRELLARSGQR